MTRRTLFQFGYRRSPDQDAPRPAHRPVVVVGAGPVGLCAAIDLAQRGVRVLLVDDSDRIGEGSRGICYAKRSLEILARLGVAERCLAKGVTWKLGKVFQRDELLYAFDLLPESGHRMPAFINLQQYYLEHFLVERAAGLDGLEIRWRNRATALQARNDGATLTLDTPDGPYEVEADWVIAADGARSPLRRMLGLGFRGEVFEDRFLIADVTMRGDFPPERWFWFDPPFHGGRSALLHKQPDDVWRIDLQLGADADAIARAAELVRVASRPLLFVGGGALISEAGDAVLALAEGVARDRPLLFVLAIERPAQLDQHEDDEPESLYLARRLRGHGRARWVPLDPVAIETLEAWTGPAAPDVLERLLDATGARAAWAADLWRHWRAAGVVVAPEGRPFSIMGFTVRDGRIVAIDALADPERLRELDITALD
jgi:hypothetical protein